MAAQAAIHDSSRCAIVLRMIVGGTQEPLNFRQRPNGRVLAKPIDHLEDLLKRIDQ
jgi:hypothetical protein